MVNGERPTTNDHRPSSVARSGDLRPTTYDLRRLARERLIIALDVPSLEEATRLVEILAPEIVWFKVGSELFTSAGPAAVAMVRARGGRVFLDLKYHDIPNTVAGAIAAAARLGVSMLTLHIAGGVEMMRAAAEALVRTPNPEPRTPDSTSRPLLLGVTLLTSAEEEDTVHHVIDAALQARECGLDGVIAAAREAGAIKAACGREFLVVSPGIRPASQDPNDQRRTATPADALRAGADFLVVGRPILRAPDPLRAAEAILAAMDAVVE